MLDNIFFCMNNFHLACPLQENSSLSYREIGYPYRTFAFLSYPVFELNQLVHTCLYAFINIFCMLSFCVLKFIYNSSVCRFSVIRVFISSHNLHREEKSMNESVSMMKKKTKKKLLMYVHSLKFV